MSVGYSGIQWNRQKKVYDLTLALILLAGIGVYVAVSSIAAPRLTVETLILRGTALAGFGLLHVILCIGPLARLDRRFLPLLYNRRHLGVTMFVLALVHASFAIFQFHALSGTNPLVSVFTAYRADYAPWVAGTANIANFPFEPLGAAALAILFVMAATSHDFWLRNLGPSFWKALHLAVLGAYGLLVGHVAYGVLQSERSVALALLLGCGVAAVLGLHAAAALREARADREVSTLESEGYVRACRTNDLIPGRGRTVRIGEERVALFFVDHGQGGDGRVYAVSNVCRHQGGPLGEGRILDGCITCPWHGWQYRPEDGCSPPPFQEKVETYRVRIADGAIWVHPEPSPPGTPQAGAVRPAGSQDPGPTPQASPP